MSGSIKCHRCNHENDPGARVCVNCYARLGDAARAKGRMGIRARLANTPTGRFLPYLVIILFMLPFLLLRPNGDMVSGLLVQFGLLGLVALGVTFPLVKGHYDLSAGPVAGLAACITIMATHSEQMLTLPIALTAALAGVGVGIVAGLLNGLIVGRTRIPSALFTVMLGVVAMEMTHQIVAQQDLTVGDPGLLALGEADFMGIPAALMLLIAAALVSVLLFRRETFWPLTRVSTRQWTMRLTAPNCILSSFLMSGVFAGLAGVFIAACALPAVSPLGHSTWLLAPIAAALLGGGVVIAGTGGVGTAIAGAAALSLLSFTLHKLHVPAAGPVADAVILLFLLMAGRLLALTWYEIQELQRGNVLGIPGAQRIPDILFHSKYSRPLWAAITVLLAVGIYTYIAYYSALYIPDDQVAIAAYDGDVRIALIQDETTIQIEPAEGLLLARGATVQTGANSTCLLRLSDDSQVHIEPNSSLRIANIVQMDDGTRDVRMQMGLGSVWVNVRTLLTPESRFEVKTPMLTVAVRGTAFQIDANEKATKIGVLDGAVSIMRFFMATDRYGTSETRQEQGKVFGGEGLTAFVDLPLGKPYPLPQIEKDRMRNFANQATAELRGAFFGVEFAKSLGGALLLGISIWLIILYAQAGPATVITPEDVAEAARRLESTRTGSADDSPRSVAIAQMHLKLGDKQSAIRELQNIVERDPNSQYGQWAQRMLTTLMSRNELDTEEDSDQEADK